jgi:hypothetical protein
MVHISVPQSDKRATAPVIEGTKVKSLEETVGVEPSTLTRAVGALEFELTEKELKHLEEPSQPIPIIRTPVDPGREEGTYTLPSDHTLLPPHGRVRALSMEPMMWC